MELTTQDIKNIIQGYCVLYQSRGDWHEYGALKLLLSMIDALEDGSYDLEYILNQLRYASERDI